MSRSKYERFSTTVDLSVGGKGADNVSLFPVSFMKLGCIPSVWRQTPAGSNVYAFVFNERLDECTPHRDRGGRVECAKRTPATHKPAAGCSEGQALLPTSRHVDHLFMCSRDGAGDGGDLFLMPGAGSWRKATSGRSYKAPTRRSGEICLVVRGCDGTSWRYNVCPLRRNKCILEMLQISLKGIGRNR